MYYIMFVYDCRRILEILEFEEAVFLRKNNELSRHGVLSLDYSRLWFRKFSLAMGPQNFCAGFICGAPKSISVFKNFTVGGIFLSYFNKKSANFYQDTFFVNIFHNMYRIFLLTPNSSQTKDSRRCVKVK